MENDLDDNCDEAYIDQDEDLDKVDLDVNKDDLDEDSDFDVPEIDQEEDDQVTLLEEEELARSEGNDKTRKIEFEFGMDLEFQALSISPNQDNTKDNGTI